MKEKKINRKKTHKEERRDLSLSLTLLHFLPPASLVFFLSSSQVCLQQTLDKSIYKLSFTRRQRERERERERENNKEREKRERGNLSSLSLFVNPKSNPLTFCALDGSLTAANPGVPFK